MIDEAQDKARYQEKMKKRHVARDKMLADRSAKKGLLIVNTGPSKGKSTAAFGMAVRCIGHGKKVAIIQFVKGSRESAERRVFESFGEQVVIRAMGEGFTWETQDKDRDRAAAEKAWAFACEFIGDEQWDMVILDELNIVLRDKGLDIDKVLEVLNSRAPMQHVVVTGRNARPELIEAADLVTEMTMVKHPFRDGIGPQAGVEY